MPPAKAPIRPGSWTSTASNTSASYRCLRDLRAMTPLIAQTLGSAATELGWPALAEGGHALRQVLAGPRAVERGLELLAGRTVQGQLVAGDRQWRQCRDLAGPCQRIVQIADALDEAEPVGV